MNHILGGVFNLLKDYEVGIIGSGILNPDKAKDIDVLFLVKDEFEQACHKLGKRWNGWDAWNGHVRIANYLLDGKKIQMIHISSVTSYDLHPHCVLLRDGSMIKEGKFFVKPEGWKYEKFPDDKALAYIKGGIDEED